MKNKPVKKKRRCLRCDHNFLSLGPQNRLCGVCVSKNQKDGDDLTVCSPISHSANRLGVYRK